VTRETQSLFCAQTAVPAASVPGVALCRYSRNAVTATGRLILAARALPCLAWPHCLDVKAIRVPALIVTSIVRAPSPRRPRRPALRRARPTARYGLMGEGGRRCRTGCRRTLTAAPPRPRRRTHAAARPEPRPDRSRWPTGAAGRPSAALVHCVAARGDLAYGTRALDQAGAVARATAVLIRAARTLGGPHKICRCGFREPKVLLSRYRLFPAFHCRLTLNAQ